MWRRRVRRWGHEERTNGFKDSGANGGGTEVSGKETRRCGEGRGDAGKNEPGENAGGAVQVQVGTRSGEDAKMGGGDGGFGGDDDDGSGVRPGNNDWPEWHGLEDDSEMSGPSGQASEKSGLAQSSRITFDKDNQVVFALNGAAAKEQLQSLMDNLSTTGNLQMFQYLNFMLDVLE